MDFIMTFYNYNKYVRRCTHNYIVNAAALQTKW